MAGGNNSSKKEEETNPNMFLGEYNLSGIPFHNFVNAKDLSFMNGNVIRDVNRAIILKPITREKIIEVMVDEIDEKVICVPQVQIVDKYIEVVKPIIRYKIKEVKRPVTVERIKKVPKIIEEEKIVEVPEIQYVEKFVDVPKIIQKEKIIEIPLPIVHERRIPVLNVLRKERFEEIDGLEYKFTNSNSDFSLDKSSTDNESSINLSPMKYDNKDRDNDEIQREITHQPLEDKKHMKAKEKENIRNEHSDLQNYSNLRNFDSKMVNYNSTESEKRLIDQLTELSKSSINNEIANNSNEYSHENKIEIEYRKGDFEYPNLTNLSISESSYDYEKSLNQENVLGMYEEASQDEDERYEIEKREQEVRKGRFESKILISDGFQEELSKKMIKSISTQVIPKSLSIVEKRRRSKDKK